MMCPAPHLAFLFINWLIDINQRGHDINNIWRLTAWWITAAQRYRCASRETRRWFQSSRPANRFVLLIAIRLVCAVKMAYFFAALMDSGVNVAKYIQITIAGPLICNATWCSNSINQTSSLRKFSASSIQYRLKIYWNTRSIRSVERDICLTAELHLLRLPLVYSRCSFPTKPGLKLSSFGRSSVTWPKDSQYMVYYRWSIWTNRLSRTVAEILSLKDTGIMTLTFRDHVPSSVTSSHDHWMRSVSFSIGVLCNHHYISHDCWDLMCQTLSQRYSHWKCIDLCFRDKIGVCSILQLCAYSCSRGTSFELLTATVGPRALLLRYLDLPIENALRGQKLGLTRGRDHRILTLRIAFLHFAPPTYVQNFSKVEQK